MSQWTSPGRIVTGLVSVALLVALGASMTGAQRAQSLGLTRHGQLITVQDAGAADKAPAPSLEINTSRQFLPWLVEQKISLALTTYQAGKLFLLEDGAEAVRDYAARGKLADHGEDLRLTACDPFHGPGKFDRLRAVGPEQRGHPLVDRKANAAQLFG